MRLLDCVRRRPAHPSRSVPTAVAALSQLLRERPARVLVHRAGGIQLLAPLIRAGATASPPNNQLLYEVGLCAWQLSYYQPAAEAMGPTGIVPGLVELVRSGAKEKVGLVHLLSWRWHCVLAAVMCMRPCVRTAARLVCFNKEVVRFHCKTIWGPAAVPQAW